jgi:hypothetical protein
VIINKTPSHRDLPENYHLLERDYIFFVNISKSALIVNETKYSIEYGVLLITLIKKAGIRCKGTMHHALTLSHFLSQITPANQITNPK